jgi:hypothetical protein
MPSLVFCHFSPEDLPGNKLQEFVFANRQDSTPNGIGQPIRTDSFVHPVREQDLTKTGIRQRMRRVFGRVQFPENLFQLGEVMGEVMEDCVPWKSVKA